MKLSKIIQRTKHRLQRHEEAISKGKDYPFGWRGSKQLFFYAEQVRRIKKMFWQETGFIYEAALVRV